MDKYLLELLKDVSTIIIPGLGALTITDKRTGEIMFMSYLKHDDGALINYIAEKEGMDQNDAKNLVAKYVREILAKLDQGETYDMFQFGSFYKLDDEVDFRAWEGQKSSHASETAVDLEEETNKENKEHEDNIFVPPVVDNPSEEINTPQEVMAEETDVNNGDSSVNESPTESIRQYNIAEKEEQEKNKAKLENLKKAKADKQIKKKRGVGFYLLVSLIILIVAGGSLVGIFFDDVKKHLPFLAEEIKTDQAPNELDEMKETLGITEDVEVVQNETDTLNYTESTELLDENEDISSQTESADSEVAEELKVTSYPEATSGKYHIIAGAFSSLDNANRMAAKLNQGGYQASVKMQGSLHFVSAKAFHSKEAANSELSNVRTIASNAWVYAWP